ncbi:hypothetical protein GCM10028821_25470 [Hymenobacter jeollabukensis]
MVSWLFLSWAAVACQPESARQTPSAADVRFVTYRVDPRCQPLALYWRDEHQQPLRSLGRLSSWLAGQGWAQTD